MRFDIISDDGVLATTHILTYIRYILLYTARNMISAISHTSNYSGKIYFAVLRILSSVPLQYALNVTEPEAMLRDIVRHATVRVVVTVSVRLLLFLIHIRICTILGREQRA